MEEYYTVFVTSSCINSLVKGGGECPTGAFTVFLATFLDRTLWLQLVALSRVNGYTL